MLALAAHQCSRDDPLGSSGVPSPALRRRELLELAAAAMVLSLPRPAAASEGVPKGVRCCALCWIGRQECNSCNGAG